MLFTVSLTSERSNVLSGLKVQMSLHYYSTAIKSEVLVFPLNSVNFNFKLYFSFSSSSKHWIMLQVSQREKFVSIITFNQRLTDDPESLSNSRTAGGWNIVKGCRPAELMIDCVAIAALNINQCLSKSKYFYWYYFSMSNSLNDTCLLLHVEMNIIKYNWT